MDRIGLQTYIEINPWIRSLRIHGFIYIFELEGIKDDSGRHQ